MLIKRGKIWYYQTKINSKTWKRSTGETDRRRAEKIARQIEAQARLRKNRPDDWLKFSAAAHREVQRLEIDVSPRQAQRALDSFTKFLEWLGRDPEITEIDTGLLEEYQRYRLQSKSLSTVGKDLCFILRLLRRNGITLNRPSAKPGKMTETRTLTHEELVRFFENTTLRFRPLYATLLCTGARLAELAPSPRSNHTPLLKTEVDFDKGLILLRQAKNHPGKQAKARPPIPVPQELLDLLEWQIRQTPAEYPLVFLRQHNPSREFNAALKRAGIPVDDAAGRHLWLHSFRHTYCTMMGEQVANAWQLKEILGHAKISTTEKYTHVKAEIVPIAAINIGPRHLLAELSSQ